MVRKAGHDLSEGVGDGGLADPAESERAERDAELDGGEEVVQVLLEALDGAGAGDAERDELLKAGVAHADEGELGGDEEAVSEDERDDRHEPE